MAIKMRVVGMQWRLDKVTRGWKIFKKEGSGAVARLRADPKNPADKDAIKVQVRDVKRRKWLTVGFLPASSTAEVRAYLKSAGGKLPWRVRFTVYKRNWREDSEKVSFSVSILIPDSN